MTTCFQTHSVSYPSPSQLATHRTITADQWAAAVSLQMPIAHTAPLLRAVAVLNLSSRYVGRSGVVERNAMTEIAAIPPTGKPHPALAAVAEARAANTQLRVADAITKFAGSMVFVYVHIAIFAVWMLVLEKSPWPTLTL